MFLKRLLILLILFLSNNPGYSQLDSLAKFSYLIYDRFNSFKIYRGTCFFIKVNEKTFLITAAHVISGWDCVKYKYDDDSTDNYAVVLHSKVTGESSIFGIDLTQFKKRCQGWPFFLCADVCAIPVNIPAGYDVNAIPLDQMRGKPDTTIIWGYPRTNPRVHTAADMIQTPPSVIGAKFNCYISRMDTLGIKVDTINYYSTIKYDKERGGFSGSPVFFCNGNSALFGGIYFADNADTFYFVRPDQVMYAIQSSFSYVALDLNHILF